MKTKFISLVLALSTATVTLQSSPYRCKASGDNLEADIIVIGGGTAGCILMEQLSANGRFSVLGIEGGLNLTNDPALEAVGLPALQLGQSENPRYFWPGWTTLPMPGLNGRTNVWTLGKVLGGGSSINGLYYGRGSNAVYSQWEGVAGSGNWSLENILTTFNALENYQGLTFTTGARGNNGPVSVLQTPTVSELTLNVLLPASMNAFPDLLLVSDYNDPSVENCIDLRAQWFIDPTGTERVSSATAFLNNTVMTSGGQGVNGHKLFMLFGAVAEKIIFGKHGRAKKVRYSQNGKVFEAKARKAVILASGINNSKLLQLSGIGPSQALKNAGIKPLFINENVGKHLQNHPLISILLAANPADNGIPPGAPYAFTIQNVYLPAVYGPSDSRALQILFEYIPSITSPLIAVRLKLLNPLSEGSITIQNDNPYQIPAADDGVYQDSMDLENMKSAIKTYVRSLLEQLQLVGYPFYQPIPSDPINAVIASTYNDAVVEAYVKNNTNLSQDANHFTSHCKMAPLNAGGVVDGTTCVYGTKNVYVVDDSICPVIPDIDTAAAAMMIGLRSSAILKQVLKKE